MSKKTKEKEKTSLKLGKMTSKELATWFGISYNTYHHKIPDYLRDLELFCYFKPIYGGVIIEEIYPGCEQYKKNYDPSFVEKVKEIILNCPEGYSGPNSRLLSQREIALAIEQEQSREPGRQTQTKVKRACEELLGKPAKGDDAVVPGVIGERKYVWAIKLDYAPNNHRPLTDDEYKCYKDLLKGALTSEEHLKEVEKLAGMEAAYRCGDATKEEYEEAKKKYNFDFKKVLD